jgi:hypothetical protein
MKRQALNISINELEQLRNSLIKEYNNFNKTIGFKDVDYNKQWLIPIINETPEQSDTWKLEDERKNKIY